LVTSSKTRSTDARPRPLSPPLQSRYGSWVMKIVHGWAQRQQEKKENECDQREKFSRKGKNAPLVHGLRKNPHRRANLSAGSSRAGRAAVQGICRGGVPRASAPEAFRCVVANR